MDFSTCNRIMENISRVIIGKQEAIKHIVVALLADGHVLLEDVPGVGKTMLAQALAHSIGGSYQRIQFTPDLLPSDITGFNIYVQHEGCFRFQQGPVMTNILLADEINRTVPRTQSSLLESMEERQVTVDRKTYQLPQPFFVIATQNPVEQEGTFPLPEAQLDRFLLRVELGYPTMDEEIAILSRFETENPLKTLQHVTSPEDIFTLQQARKNIIVADQIKTYIAAIVQATRDHQQIRFGASPRASMALMRASQALAAIEGREFVLPDDVKALALPVLGHRLILHDQEKIKGTLISEILTRLIDTISIPGMAA